MRLMPDIITVQEKETACNCEVYARMGKGLKLDDVDTQITPRNIINRFIQGE